MKAQYKERMKTTILFFIALGFILIPQIGITQFAYILPDTCAPMDLPHIKKEVEGELFKAIECFGKQQKLKRVRITETKTTGPNSYEFWGRYYKDNIISTIEGVFSAEIVVEPASERSHCAIVFYDAALWNDHLKKFSLMDCTGDNRRSQE